MKPNEFNEILKEYNIKLSEFKKFEKEVANILKKSISKSTIKIHSVTSRVKTFDSCLKKIVKYEMKNPFEEVQDIVGLRVVCLFLSDLDKIEKVINKTFQVIEKEDKTNESPKNAFGYMGTHFIVIPKDENVPCKLPFEIQVRTISQDAWASVSWHLDYKNNSVREDLKRDFQALSGLFYVADTHFSFIEHNRNEI